MFLGHQVAHSQSGDALDPCPAVGQSVCLARTQQLVTHGSGQLPPDAPLHFFLPLCLQLEQRIQVAPGHHGEQARQ